MVKVPTDRVTVRLNKHHLDTIDALIQMGQIRNRTQAISEAVRDYVNNKSITAKAAAESAKNAIDLQTLAAQIAQMQSQVEKLRKK